MHKKNIITCLELKRSIKYHQILNVTLPLSESEVAFILGINMKKELKMPMVGVDQIKRM